jgi:hypothetical protein
MARGRLGRGALWVAGAVALILAIVVTRAVMSARTELRDGEAALARGDVVLAIDAFERAGRLRVPAARIHGVALDRLEAIGARAAAAGDLDTARAAYAAARRALLGSRVLTTPEPARLQRVDARLAALLARAGTPAGDAAASQAWHAARLAATPAPRPGFTLLLLLGFGLWVAGAAALALGGIGPDDRLRRPQAALAAAAIVVGLVLWLVGLWRA